MGKQTQVNSFKSLPINILYVFTSGRKERLASSEQRKSFPIEMLYGFPYFQNKEEYQTDFIESRNLKPENTSWYAKFLNFQNKYAARLLKMGIPASSFLSITKKINRFDIIIGVPDSVALALAFLKKSGRVQPKLVYFAMGLASRLMILKESQNFLYPIVRRYYGNILRQCNQLIFLGKSEYDFFQREFSSVANRSVFMPFCVDTDFWRPLDLKKKQYILFVGNDVN